MRRLTNRYTGCRTIRRTFSVTTLAEEIVEKTICSELWHKTGTEQLTSSIRQVLEGELSPYALARSIVEEYSKHSVAGRQN